MDNDLLDIPNIIGILGSYKELTKKVTCYMLFAKKFKELWDGNNSEEFKKFMKDSGEYILDIIDHINDNREKYHPFRKIDIFTELVNILTDWKYMFENPDHILKTRICINWIKRKW
jgi:restriction endonuclease